MSGDLRDLIESARRDAPSGADRARMRALLEARLAGASTSPPRSPQSSSLADGAKMAVSRKVLAAGALALGLSTFGAGYWMGHAGAPEPMPALAASARAPFPTVAASLPAVAAPPASLPVPAFAPPVPAFAAPTPSLPDTPDTLTSPRSKTPPRSPERQAPAPAAEPPVEDTTPATRAVSAPQSGAPASTLGAELALLRRAQESLRDGDSTAALRLVGELEDKHPRGLLAAERDALRVLALCAAGRVAEAKASAERFRREHPGSPHAARVRASCGGAP